MNLIATFQTPMEENRIIRITGDRVEIGRDSESDICLDHPSVSRKHACISIVEGKSFFSLKDRGSANGTYVDGMMIDDAEILHGDQEVRIGPFRFRICHSPETSIPGEERMPAEGLTRENEREIMMEAINSLPKILDSETGKDGGDDRELASRAEKHLYPRILGLLPPHADPKMADDLTKKALTHAMGLGPLHDWLNDPSIDEIMVNGLEGVYLESGGKLTRRDPVFSDEHSLMRVIDRILAPLGRRVDESTPYMDGRLPDGSRINVIIPPVSLMGPVLTIRKFPAERLDIEKLVELGSLTQDAAEMLASAVHSRTNILISGGTGTGKTTLLNCLASFIPEDERIITIEDTAELDLHQDHVIRLETRPPNVEGLGEIPARDLVKNSLRMRPDRIIVGECRGGEAMDMLQAMNTGHDGSMTTCHANSPRDALKRIEIMAMMAGLDIPYRAIREQVTSAIQLVIQISRSPEGRRIVSSITEVDRLEGDQILTQDIFTFRKDSGSNELRPTGMIPSFSPQKDRKRASFEVAGRIIK